jgi:hypothetical protein
MSSISDSKRIDQGFFVKIRDSFYAGPFSTLNQARDEARRLGPGFVIYHGVLKGISEGLIDDSELYVVQKVQH